MPDFRPTASYQVVVKTPVGSTLDYTRDRVLEVVRRLNDAPEVAYTYKTIGGGGHHAQVERGHDLRQAHAQGRRAELSQQELERVLRRELARSARR